MKLRPAQVLVAGSYSSTVENTEDVLSVPPTAYTLPFAAAATPSQYRAVGMGARTVQVFVPGSYCSTTERAANPVLLPPIA
ncbi:MAG TPA: hypothetical protein VII06_30190 [Chloroflexota bacterium]|jgi:hypothetical protein